MRGGLGLTLRQALLLARDRLPARRFFGELERLELQRQALRFLFFLCLKLFLRLCDPQRCFACFRFLFLIERERALLLDLFGFPLRGCLSEPARLELQRKPALFSLLRTISSISRASASRPASYSCCSVRVS